MLKISIITVSYNSVATIEDTIKSVLSQTYQNIEYIIIDGKSTDGTLEIINKYKDKIAKIISEPDKGLFDAINKGIRLATGEIIGILHSDDLYNNEKVISIVAKEMEEKKLDACWSDLVYVNRDDTSKIVRVWKSSSYEEGKFRKGWMPPHPTFFAGKNIFEKYGVYNLNFKLAADYELMLRFLEKYKIKSNYIPEILMKMRVGGVSNRSFKNIKTIVKSNIDCYRAFKENGLKINPLIILIKPLSKIFQSFYKN
ncbi:MAG: glycosyltransferase family 2 protein [Patescibacteria group bacterium]